MPGVGDTCPDCRRGNLVRADPRQAFDAICPRCCHTEYAQGGA